MQRLAQQSREMIKYRYALGSNDSAVNVTILTDATRYSLAPYTCFGCGREMVANLGTQKIKHFSHKSVGTCHPESYLHRLAKRVFLDRYTRSLTGSTPFYLVQKVPGECSHYSDLFDQPCSLTRSRRHDLTRYFTKITIETPINGVVPDALLTSDDEQGRLFVEFAVTHKCDESKIALGERIIEIEVKTEDDLAVFTDGEISEDDERVTLMNVERKPVRGDLCKGSCNRAVQLFFVFKSGKALLRWFQPEEAHKLWSKKNLLRKESLGPHDINKPSESGNGPFKLKVREAFFDGVHIKNCFNCRYHGLGQYEDPVFCKLRKQGVGSNEASNCTTYKPFQSEAEAVRADKENEDYLNRPGRPQIPDIYSF
jgi:hypothetical protein